MTKLLQQLNFSSSNYFDVAIEPNAVVKPNFSEGASLSAAGSKRSALSASDAECFSLCLGAGPLCSKRYALSASDAECFLPPTGLCGGPDVPAHGSAPPGGVNGGASSPAPSTPSHDDNCDLLSALLCGRSVSGSTESLVSNQSDHPVFQTEDREAVINKILERKDQQPVKINFKIFLTENTATHWEAVVHGSTVYLRMPGVLSSGSKESFMVLLDFAEERLNCTSCIVCVRKSRAERAVLLRTFMFMGFQPLPPNAPTLPRELAHPDYLCLHYNMQ